MRNTRYWRSLVGGVSLGACLSSGSSGDAGASIAALAEAPFIVENDAAMTKMMSGMSIKRSGDADRDFALMMIAHHQGAVDMAQAELRHGTNEQLRRIAQEIVVDQLQEITAMRLAIGEPLPQSGAVPTQGWKVTQPVLPAGKESLQ